MAEEHPHRVPSGLLAGTPYRLLRRLGAAPTGELFEVEHVELGKLFVLKTLPPSGPRFDRVERLRNEFRALARLAHPNIVAVTDAGATARGMPYFVMPRFRGETLATRLARGALRITEALGIAADIAAALGAAHSIGVLHRDVRPDNILLEPGGAKLADFGVAKFLGASGMTTRHLGVGTPRYMSPEQVAGGHLDARSDLFALGLVLYAMIAGAGPDDDVTDEAELLARRTSRPAPRLATRVPGVDAELSALVGKLLALEPVRRPLDAQGVARQLRRIAARVAGAVAFDAPTREVHYDAVTDPGPAPRPDGDATRADAPGPRPDGDATRPDGVAVAGRRVVEPAPAAPEPPPTRFDLPRAGAACAFHQENHPEEPTTERIVRAAAPPRAPAPVHPTAHPHRRFLALCAAAGGALGVVAVVAVACAVAVSPEPVGANRATPSSEHTARALAPEPRTPEVLVTATAPRVAPPPAPAAPSAAPPATPRERRPAIAPPPPRRAAARHDHASPAAAAITCFRAPAVSSGVILPGSGL